MSYKTNRRCLVIFFSAGGSHETLCRKYAAYRDHRLLGLLTLAGSRYLLQALQEPTQRLYISINCCNSVLLAMIAYLILSSATTATRKMARLAAQKLIHPPVPPTNIRQRKPNAISVAIAIANTMRRSIFLLSRGSGYTFPRGPSLSNCS